MKETLILALLSCVVSALAAAESINNKIEVGKNQLIHIKSPVDSVKLSGWDDKSLMISGETSGKYILEKNKDVILFEVKTDATKKSESEILLNIPFDTRLKVETKAADITLSDIRGDITAISVDGAITGQSLSKNINLNSVNGEVGLFKSSGDLKLETVNGELNVRDSEGTAFIKTISGAVDVESNVSALSAENMSGDVRAIVGRVQELKLNTVNGDIELKASPSESANIELESVNGNIELYFPEDVSASFKVNIHKEGEISNKFTQDAPQAVKNSSASELVFNKGEGSASVEVSTLGGNVSLAKLQETSATAPSQDIAQEFSWSDVDSKYFDFAYIKPNTNFSDYSEIYIDLPTVEFDERWLRDYSDNALKTYKQRTVDSYRKIFKEELSELLTKKTHLKIVEKRTARSLVVLPKIKHLYIRTPDVPGIKDTVLTWAGYAAIDLTIYSPVEKAVVGFFFDKRNTSAFSATESVMKPRVANERGFKKLFQKWSKYTVHYVNTNKG